MSKQSENLKGTDKNETLSQSKNLSMKEQYDLADVKMELLITSLKQELASPKENYSPEQKDKLSQLLNNVIADKQKMPDIQAQYIEGKNSIHKEAKQDLNNLLKQINNNTTIPGGTTGNINASIPVSKTGGADF